MTDQDDDRSKRAVGRPPPPVFTTVTIKSKSKRRFSILQDRALAAFMKNLGYKLHLVQPKMPHPGRFLGAFLLPTNCVLEVFEDKNKKLIGFLFSNLDVWANFDAARDSLQAAPRNS